MIHDLSVYNAWKRSTLDRLTAKYRDRLSLVVQRHLERVRVQIERALISGLTEIEIDDPLFENEIMRVLLEHEREAIFVGVSDAIREVSPEKQLSTWTRWPYSYPVEQTFVTLAEKTQRDKIAKDIWGFLGGKSRKHIQQVAKFKKKTYLDALKKAYKASAKDYLTNEKTTDTKATITGLFKEVFKKSSNDAERIFRTETTRFFNDARVKYFKEKTEVDFVQLIAVTDGRVSDICEARDLYVLPIEKAGLKKFKPPFHPNCRTIQSPLDTDTKSDTDEVKRHLGAEFGTVVSKTSGKTFKGTRVDPSKKHPLPKGWI